MTAPTETLLALLRAARDFTRRMSPASRTFGADELERAAIAHAEARGFVSASAAHDIAIEHATLGKNMDAAYQRRIDALEGALREVVDAQWAHDAAHSSQARETSARLDAARRAALAVLG